jgi:circadian clock protein KaiC
MKSTDGLNRVSTGVPGLDDILSGGLPANRLCLIEGDPGVGKTTLALQFLMAGVRNGERTLYITLSETREELENVAESHGWKLDGIDLYELSAMDRYLRAESDNSVFYPAEVELTETTRDLIDLFERTNPSRAVFDSLSEMKLLARDPLRYRRQILALKQFFTGRNCTVLLLDDRTASNADTQVHSISHGVINMEQVPISYGTDRRRIRVLKLRGVAYRSGHHDMIMETGGLTIFPRLVASEHRLDVEENLISSGVPSLDDALGGGIDRGVSTLLIGPAGAGKSSVAVQFAVAAAERGEKSVIYCFEESPRTLYKRSMALGMDLHRHVAEGAIEILHVDPAELTPGEFIHRVRKSVEHGNVSVVIVDSLNGFLNAMPDERYLLLQLHELFAFLGQQGISSFLVVAQHGMLGTGMTTPVDVSYLADTVLTFRLYEYEGKLCQALSVLKRRGGEHDRSIRPLTLAGGIALGEPVSGLRGVLTGVPVVDKTGEQAD